jgi:hypothetical protein
VAQNQRRLHGEDDALVANGVSPVGLYRATAQWGGVTGGWSTKWSSWGATTGTTASQALTDCTGHPLTGGPSSFMPFTPQKQGLDEKVVC